MPTSLDLNLTSLFYLQASGYAEAIEEFIKAHWEKGPKLNHLGEVEYELDPDDLKKETAAVLDDGDFSGEREKEWKIHHRFNQKTKRMEYRVVCPRLGKLKAV